MDILAQFNHPDYGHDGDIEEAKEKLKIGEYYKLNGASIGQSCSYIYLEEGVFNSIQFDYFEGGKQVSIFDYPELNPYIKIRKEAK